MGKIKMAKYPVRNIQAEIAEITAISKKKNGHIGYKNSRGDLWRHPPPPARIGGGGGRRSIQAP